MANESPWARTKIRDGQYLDILKIRPVPEDSDDVIYEIQSQYHQRPDLLAYDMYGSSKLWWVYAQRNMDTLKDPVYDFQTGLSIYVPKGSRLRQLLGG
jgi:hypothetical protein|tara:strand:- start:8063 stop:8356 length:294 start_codon:yes stop_codon:yes gene_type:complete